MVLEAVWIRCVLGASVEWRSAERSCPGFISAHDDGLQELGHACHLASEPLQFPWSDEESKKCLCDWSQFRLNELLHQGFRIMGDNTGCVMLVSL